MSRFSKRPLPLVFIDSDARRTLANWFDARGYVWHFKEGPGLAIQDYSGVPSYFHETVGKGSVGKHNLTLRWELRGTEYVGLVARTLWSELGSPYAIDELRPLAWPLKAPTSYCASPGCAYWRDLGPFCGLHEPAAVFAGFDPETVRWWKTGTCVCGSAESDAHPKPGEPPNSRPSLCDHCARGLAVATDELRQHLYKRRFAHEYVPLAWEIAKIRVERLAQIPPILRRHWRESRGQL